MRHSEKHEALLDAIARGEHGEDMAPFAWFDFVVKDSKGKSVKLWRIERRKPAKPSNRSNLLRERRERETNVERYREAVARGEPLPVDGPIRWEAACDTQGRRMIERDRGLRDLLKLCGEDSIFYQEVLSGLNEMTDGNVSEALRVAVFGRPVGSGK